MKSHYRIKALGRCLLAICLIGCVDTLMAQGQPALEGIANPYSGRAPGTASTQAGRKPHTATAQASFASPSRTSRRSPPRAPGTATPLAQLVAEAEANNPRIIAARRASQAASLAPSPASTLPDPEITVQEMSAATPIPVWDLNTVEMTYASFGVSQAIPYPGKLRLRGEILQRAAAVTRDQLTTVRRQIIDQLKTAYFQLAYIQQALRILHRDRELLREIEKIVEARYRVGQGTEQDVLKAQLQETKLLRDIDFDQDQRGSLEAQLKQILNRAPDSGDIGAGTLTITPLPYTSDDLLALVRAQNPAVEAEQQAVREQGLQVELARKDFYPDFDIEAAWQHTGRPFPDRYMLGVGIRLPIYRSRRQQPELAESVEKLNRSRRLYEAQVQRAYFEVRDQYLSAQTAAQVVRIYRQGLIPQATATFDAGLAAYQTGKKDVQSLLDSFLDVLNLDTQYWREIAQHEVALAHIEQLTGVRLP
jgi:outer membrane protein, heavy metal efflux system